MKLNRGDIVYSVSGREMTVKYQTSDLTFTACDDGTGWGVDLYFTQDLSLEASK